MCTRPREERVQDLQQGEEKSLDKKPLEVLVFSDVHGECTTGSASDWPNKKEPDHMGKFRESAAAQAIEKTTAHLIIFAGDSTTIPKTVDCTDENIEELKAFITWFEGVQPDKPKFLIPGNHDTCLDDSMTAKDPGLDTKRVELIARMKAKKIFFVGAAGAVKIPVADGKEFKMILSGFSEGRVPGGNKFYEDVQNIPEGKTEFTVDELKALGVGITPLLGAGQYCPAKGAPSTILNALFSYVDCNAIYQKATDMLKSASAKLGDEADLAVIHGPPDNIGFAFGPPNDKPGPMAQAVMKPLLVRQGKMMVGHYHPTGEWGQKDTANSGKRTQPLTCNNQAGGCSGTVEMTYVPVKGARPEVCEYPAETDTDHMPKAVKFDQYEVEGEINPAGINVENLKNELTADLMRKFRWTGPAFNKPDGNQIYTLEEKIFDVFVPKDVSADPPKPHFTAHAINWMKQQLARIGGNA